MDNQESETLNIPENTEINNDFEKQIIHIKKLGFFVKMAIFIAVVMFLLDISLVIFNVHMMTTYFPNDSHGEKLETLKQFRPNDREKFGLSMCLSGHEKSKSDDKRVNLQTLTSYSDRNNNYRRGIQFNRTNGFFTIPKDGIYKGTSQISVRIYPRHSLVSFIHEIITEDGEILASLAEHTNCNNIKSNDPCYVSVLHLDRYLRAGVRISIRVFRIPESEGKILAKGTYSCFTLTRTGS